MVVESESETSKIGEQGAISQMPTKLEIIEMFTRLENSINTEIATLHEDLGQMLTRVEETEEKNGQTSL